MAGNEIRQVTGTRSYVAQQAAVKALAFALEGSEQRRDTIGRGCSKCPAGCDSRETFKEATAFSQGGDDSDSVGR